MTTSTVDTAAGVAQRAAPRRRPFPLGPSIAGVVLLATGIVLFWSAAAPATAEDSDTSLRGPWVAPLAVSTAWVALSVAYLVVQVVGWLRTRAEPEPAPDGAVATAAPDEPSGAEEDAEDDTSVRWLPLVLLVAAFAGFTLLMTPFGFVVSGALFMLVSTRLFGSPWPRHVVRDAVVAVLLPLVVYLLFAELGINLTEGVLHLNPREGELYFLPPTWEWPW